MSRNRLMCSALIALLCASAGAADAQVKGKKLYRWVDKDGKVQFSDALPAEAVDQARKEFNAESGNTAGAVDRALTPEERAALTAAAATAAEQAVRDEEQARLENAMLTAYETEADLIRAFNERTDLLKRTVEGIEVSISGQRVSLLNQLNNAAESELAKRPVDAKRIQTIADLHVEIVKQQELLVRRNEELGALSHEFEQTLARYRELRGSPDADSSAAPEPTPAPATPGGNTG